MRHSIACIFAFITISTSTAQAADPLAPDLRRALMQRFLSSYVHPNGGFHREEKTLDAQSIELAMIAHERGVGSSDAMAQKSLLGGLALIDPAWGGVYASSLVFEKRAAEQAAAIRAYALANAAYGSSAYLGAARAIEAYVEANLTSPEGAFYAGQSGRVRGGPEPERYFELGDAERRQLGVPEIDRRILARTNGALIESLATLYAVTGDQRVLDRAVRAAEYVLAHRKLPGGGFRSDESEESPLELSDTTAMGRAMLELFAASAEEKWLAEAEDALAFIERTFTERDGGYASILAAREPGDGEDELQLARDPHENVSVARFANMLHHYTGDERYLAMAKHALRYLITRDIVERDDAIAELLLTDRELGSEPIRVIIVGKRQDPRAQALHRSALAKSGAYRLIEWVEPGPAPLRYAFVEYPRPRVSAAITCVDGHCAPPVFDASLVEEAWSELGRTDGLRPPRQADLLRR